MIKYPFLSRFKQKVGKSTSAETKSADWVLLKTKKCILWNPYSIKVFSATLVCLRKNYHVLIIIISIGYFKSNISEDNINGHK